MTASTGHEQAARHAEYDRWVEGASAFAAGARWFMGGGQWLANAALYRLPTNLKLDATTKLLDIGCGRGTVLRALDDALGCDVAPVGLDLSRATLRLAADDERNPRRGAGLVQGSAISLPFRDGAFNLVTCGYALKHLHDDDVRALLIEVLRVLEPGGLGVIWEFGPTGNPRLDAWNHHVLSLAALPSTGGAAPLRLRSDATLKRLATEARFPYVRDANLRPFLFPPIPRASILVGRPPEGFDPDRL